MQLRGLFTEVYLVCTSEKSMQGTSLYLEGIYNGVVYIILENSLKYQRGVCTRMVVKLKAISIREMPMSEKLRFLL